MDDALTRGTTLIQNHGGPVPQHASDNILAALGANSAREDDAECAVHCGLALLALGTTLSAEVLAAHGHNAFNIRVGSHTGDVLLGSGVDADGSIRGMAVNIAARMEQRVLSSAAAAQAEQVTQSRFNAGLTDWTQTLDARQARVAAQSAEILSRQQQALAPVFLHRALGGGWLSTQR